MNPFKFGVIVDGEYFTDREKEIKELASDIESGQPVIIIGPRRYGKSSLVNKALEQISMECIRIDMELISDETDFINTYVKKALSLNPFEKIKHYLKYFSIQPSFQINPVSGEVNVTFGADIRNKSMMLIESLELPEKIAKHNKKRIVAIFDEFQDVRRVSPGLEKKMRGVFQTHKNVSYVFIGSKESVVRDIFMGRKNPFYKFGRQKVLNKIPEKEFRDFIISRFKTAAIDISNIVDDIMLYTQYHPHYTQQLCHEIFILADKNKVAKGIIQQAIEQIVNDHSADYGKLWNKLNNTERKLVIGISFGNHAPTSHKFLSTYGIRSASTAGSAVDRLLNDGVLVRKNDAIIDVEDIFWREWLKRNR